MLFFLKLYSKFFGEFVAYDSYANAYFRSKKSLRDFGREKRWVLYKNSFFDARISSGWFLWLHYQTDVPPRCKEREITLTQRVRAGKQISEKVADEKRTSRSGASGESRAQIYHSWRPRRCIEI